MKEILKITPGGVVVNHLFTSFMPVVRIYRRSYELYKLWEMG